MVSVHNRKRVLRGYIFKGSKIEIFMSLMIKSKLGITSKYIGWTKIEQNVYLLRKFNDIFAI